MLVVVCCYCCWCVLLFVVLVFGLVVWPLVVFDSFLLFVVCRCLSLLCVFVVSCLSLCLLFVSPCCLLVGRRCSVFVVCCRWLSVDVDFCCVFIVW